MRPGVAGLMTPNRCCGERPRSIRRRPCPTCCWPHNSPMRGKTIWPKGPTWIVWLARRSLSSLAAAAEANWRPLLDRGDAHPLKSFAQGLLEILRGRAESARHLIKEGMVLNVENQDLNTDMQGVLARLDAAVASSGGDAPSGVDDGEEATLLGHFLISSYRTS